MPSENVHARTHSLTHTHAVYGFGLADDCRHSFAEGSPVHRTNVTESFLVGDNCVIFNVN